MSRWTPILKDVIEVCKPRGTMVKVVKTFSEGIFIIEKSAAEKIPKRGAENAFIKLKPYLRSVTK